MDNENEGIIKQNISIDNNDFDNQYISSNDENFIFDEQHNKASLKILNFIKNPSDFDVDPSKPETWIIKPKKNDMSKTNIYVNKEINTILNNFKSYSDLYEFYNNNRKRRKIVYNKYEDIDHDEYSDDEIEFNIPNNNNDKNIKNELQYYILDYQDIIENSEEDEKDEEDDDNWTIEPIKFQNDINGKNILLRKLINIKEKYYWQKEIKPRFEQRYLEGVVEDFDGICYFYDKEELKNIKIARVLKNILYDDYKNGDYPNIKEFADLFKK